MKALYLTSKQLRRLVKGYEVRVSRKGEVIVLASKKAKVNKVENAKKIAALESQIKALKNGVALRLIKKPKLRCTICNKVVKRPKSHMALAHAGRSSNLPHLKKHGATNA